MPSPPNGEKNWPRPLKVKSPPRPGPNVGPMFRPSRENFLLRRCASSTRADRFGVGDGLRLLLGERLGQSGHLVAQLIVLVAQVGDFALQAVVVALQSSSARPECHPACRAA